MGLRGSHPGEMILTIGVSLLGIYGQCTDFPVDNDNGRELLEVIPTEPVSIPGSDFTNLTAVEYPATDLYIKSKDTKGSP